MGKDVFLFPAHLLKSPLEGAGSVEDNEATYCAKFMENHCLSRAMNILLSL